MIEAISESNIDEVLPLIRLYQEFYKIEHTSDAKNRNFFSQFGESNPNGCQFSIRQNGLLVGFATVYFSYASSIASKVGVMNDLYVIHEHRSQGLGRQLIEHCHAYAIKNGAARLQWTTALDNKDAQKLYDSMDTDKSTWHVYTYRP